MRSYPRRESNMGKPKDPNYVVRVEKAIADKYGKETVQNPTSNWTEQKEADFLEALKVGASRMRERSKKDKKVDVNGVLISQKLLTRETNRECPVCNVYSFDKKDDVYMNKFKCCFKCYIQYVEDREERWANGWRPNLGDNKTNGNNT